MRNKTTILKMQVDSISLSQATSEILDSGLVKRSSYVCVSNVHMCMEVFDNSDFEAVVNNADLVVADGRPIFWAQRLLGFKKSDQVRGQDLMNRLCKAASEKGLNIGLYGGSSLSVLSKVKTELERANSQLKITYAFSPPFKQLTDFEMAEIANEINSAEVHILFVGIGCPKQEFWMSAQKGKVNSVMLGVGAAFDFISGIKSHAPKWMQYFGLEWLFRLLSEPKRLWKRYLLQNPRFVYYLIKQLLVNK